MPTKHLLIKGKVQGVFYRATAKEVAERLGISGWVKNTEEGHVEALVTGTKDQLEEFVAWCKQGPSKAIVADIEIAEREERHFNQFKIIRG